MISQKKIYSINRLVKIIFFLRKRGKKIVFTNGCFDILHLGHTTYLARAKRLGDILIVGVNSDNSVKLIKGKNRPINTLKDRMEILANLECVDFLCSFNQKTPINLIKKIRPHILIKGGDWRNKEVVGADFVKTYGGRVLTVDFKRGHSTTGLIKKIISLS